MFNSFLQFVHDNKLAFDAIHAGVSVANLIGFFVTSMLLLVAWRRGQVKSVSLFGANIVLAKEALVAASRAVDQHEFGNEARAPADRAAVLARRPGQRSRAATDEIDKIKAIIERAFAPDVQAKLLGKAILWVDDNPGNNESEVVALRKMGLTVQQVLSTRDGLEALAKHPYHLVISDLGRGDEKFAGHQLLDAIRATGNAVPFLLYTAEGSKPAYVADAKRRGALGSTDYPHELFEHVVALLGRG